MKTKLKPMPSLSSDAQAQGFVDKADLAQYDLSGFKPTRFEFEPKAAALNLRLPQNLLDALKVKKESTKLPKEALKNWWRCTSVQMLAV